MVLDEVSFRHDTTSDDRYHDEEFSDRLEDPFDQEAAPPATRFKHGGDEEDDQLSGSGPGHNSVQSSRTDPNDLDKSTSVSSNASSSGRTFNANGKVTKDRFTERETRNLMTLKWAIYVMFCVAAIGIGVGYFFLVQYQQSKTFEAIFETLSDQTAGSIKGQVDSIVFQITTVAKAITAQAVEEGELPTLTAFDERASSLFEDSSSVLLIASSLGHLALAPDSTLRPAIVGEVMAKSQLVESLTVELLSNKDVSSREAIISGTIDDAEFLEALQLNKDHPYSLIGVPTYETFDVGAPVLGVIFAIFSWYEIMEDIPTRDNGPIQIRMTEGCGNGFEYIIDEEEVKIPHVNWETISWAESLVEEYPIYDLCSFDMEIFPTEKMYYTYNDDLPLVFAVTFGLVIVLIFGLFHWYDSWVNSRQKKLLTTTTKTHAVVSSLFPKAVHERLLDGNEDDDAGKKPKQNANKTTNMQAFLNNGEMKLKKGELGAYGNQASKPIADLFPEATIMFADIVGFTAWSSSREPSQVFTLLETIYSDFDEIARRRGVFKVETIGDCYVAVAGLPVKTPNHALIMARFASECRARLNELVRDLCQILGPDTEELGMRIGLHSGPVTAGVLRGDRARFQLFGDTVNTTARIESTGKKNLIHISQETANFLNKAGKAHWYSQREDKVEAKGKGELTTFWLVGVSGRRRRPSVGGTSSTGSSTKGGETTERLSGDPTGTNSVTKSGTKLSDKQQRVVNWITNEMTKLLKDIELSRYGSETGASEANSSSLKRLEKTMATIETAPMDEAKPIISLPHYVERSCQKTRDDVVLGGAVLDELKTYMEAIAELYNENPFHNFEHASHVTMSVIKLMSRIVSPDDGGDTSDPAYMHNLHSQTYGIASDPLSQFAIVLSALIHDADHQGVPNSTLIKENADIASHYNEKSCAEQNSVDICWNLLMNSKYANLRAAIYHNEEELKRFRQLVINSVLATDIMDKDLSAKRKARWERAFSEDAEDEASDIAVNRRATIVIEHIIQASDVAHTMQHWHVYRKWNSRLFEELYQAYLQGRIENDPSENWYKGEIGFFDFYVIPLAKKLKECGVFGVSSDEYLNYALQNRKEWEANGRSVTDDLIRKVQRIQIHNDAMSVGASTITSEYSTDRSVTSAFSSEIKGERKVSRKASMTERSSTTSGLPETAKVLVVDSDKLMPRLMIRSINRALPSWELYHAESADEALDMVSNGDKFDLIFVDADSQKIGDVHLVTQLRQQGVEACICGYAADEHSSLEFKRSGADTFAHKPLPFRGNDIKTELVRIMGSVVLDKSGKR